jgi:hypothetical protein
MRWISVQQRCPLCQAELGRLALAGDPYFHEFEQPLSIYRRFYRRTKFRLFREPSRAQQAELFDRICRSFRRLIRERQFLIVQDSELRKLAFVSQAEIGQNQRLIQQCDSLMGRYIGTIQHFQTGLALAAD